MHTKKVATANQTSKMVAYAHQHFVVSSLRQKMYSWNEQIAI